MDTVPKTRELASGIYWVGCYDRKSRLQCNPYLIVDGEDAVLIDPGSTLDFQTVLENVLSLVPIDKIRYVVLQHQDPDLCSSMPLFESAGLRAEIVTHWRAATLIRYYGVKSPFYIVNEHEYKLAFGNGRTLYFYPTPYLHFPGAIVSYDAQSQILFSSDLFGAFTENWRLFADEVDQAGKGTYLEAMKTFHEHYMPGNEVLRPVMERLSTLGLRMIAPQHGSIIRANLPQYINTLRELECGAFLRPIKKELRKIDGFTGLCNLILKRYYSTFPYEEVAGVFANTHIVLNEAGLIADYNCTGRELWQELFRLVYSRKGINWLSFIEPYVGKLAAEYELEMPDAFSGSLLAIEKERESLDAKNQQLTALNRQLELNMAQTYETLLRCPLTKLSNEKVLKEYLRTLFSSDNTEQQRGALLFIAIDNMAKLNQVYGKEQGDEIIKAIAYELEAVKQGNYSLFKLEGPAFACHIAGAADEEALQIANALRSRIEKGEISLQRVTVSVGLVGLQECAEAADLPEQQVDCLLKTAKLRENIARSRGGNTVCHDNAGGAAVLEEVAKVLLVDTDEVNLEVLRVAFERMHYRVLTAKDGAGALQTILAEKPEAIVCEAMIPQLDGFAVREKMRASLPENDSLFVLLSHQKDAESIVRALACGVNHFFKKPYFLCEVTGVVDRRFRRR